MPRLELRTLSVGVVVALLVAGAVPAEGGTPNVGGACTTVGAKIGGGKNIAFVCAKTKGKLVWMRQAPLKNSPSGGSSSGGSNGGMSKCPVGPAVVNDIRVCSEGSAVMWSEDCQATASKGNRIDEAFAIDPRNSNVLYLGVEDYGIYKSTDAGATWNRSSSGLIGFPRKDNPKLPCISELGKIVIDPTNPNHLLLSRVGSPGTLKDEAAEDSGVYESLDAGRTWHQSYNNVAINTYLRFGLLLVNSKIWYAGSYNSGPSNSSTPGANPPNKVGIINMTRDGGKTWNELPTGLAPWADVQQLFVNPSDPNNVVGYTMARPISTGPPVFSDGLGTLQTTDGGKTWTKITNNLPDAVKAPLEVDIAPTNFSHVFFLPYNISEASSYSSTDGGHTFVGAQSFQAAPSAIARYDPHDAAGNTLLGATLTGDITASSDNGHTWKQISTIPAGPSGMSARVSVILWDPLVATTVYAGGIYQGSAPRVTFLYRSKDDGLTWHSVLDPATLKP